MSLPYTRHEVAAREYANACGLTVYYGTGYAIPSPHALVIDYGHETVVYIFPHGDDGFRDDKSRCTRKVFSGSELPMGYSPATCPPCQQAINEGI